MGLETLTGSVYINALVATNPIGASDPKSQGDDHIRGIKNVLLNTFPNITGAVNATQTELNLLDGVTALIDNPLTTRGDIIYRNATVAARLAIGTAAYTLGSDGTDPVWLTRPYDIAFTAGYAADGTETDAAVQEYGHIVLTRDVTFEGFDAYAETAPTGAAMQFDIELNGTTIWLTAPEVDAAANADDGNHALTTTTASAGDRLTFKITQVGSTVAGSGVMATLKARLR